MPYGHMTLRMLTPTGFLWSKAAYKLSHLGYLHYEEVSGRVATSLQQIPMRNTGIRLPKFLQTTAFCKTSTLMICFGTLFTLWSWMTMINLFVCLNILETVSCSILWQTMLNYKGVKPNLFFCQLLQVPSSNSHGWLALIAPSEHFFHNWTFRSKNNKKNYGHLHFRNNEIVKY